MPQGIRHTDVHLEAAFFDERVQHVRRLSRAIARGDSRRMSHPSSSTKSVLKSKATRLRWMHCLSDITAVTCPSSQVQIAFSGESLRYCSLQQRKMCVRVTMIPLIAAIVKLHLIEICYFADQLDGPHVRSDVSPVLFPAIRKLLWLLLAHCDKRY